ncbi:MAG: carboxymuconolactone decarboxylase family protein [Pseudonocardiaceae bacterium]
MSAMTEPVYPPASRDIADRRRQLAPDIHRAFDEFSKRVFADGALPEKTKQLIAVAVAHVTQRPHCIEGHTRLAHRTGASNEEIMEAIWVAAEMRAGGAFAHSTLALHALGEGSHWGRRAAARQALRSTPGGVATGRDRRAAVRSWPGGPGTARARRMAPGVRR